MKAAERNQFELRIRLWCPRNGNVRSVNGFWLPTAEHMVLVDDRVSGTQRGENGSLPDRGN
jgi:hypothetical protein